MATIKKNTKNTKNTKNNKETTKVDRNSFTYKTKRFFRENWKPVVLGLLVGLGAGAGHLAADAEKNKKFF